MATATRARSAGRQRPRGSPEPKQDAGHEEPNLMEDIVPFTLLLCLYILQGIPMGLASSIPVLLKEQGMGYGAKAIFSNVSWPYSLKMLWAPVVDALYVPAWGRRKSWVVPIQLLVGGIMVSSGTFLDTLLRPKSTGDVIVLTAIFFAVYLLVATQDIAVDGWALTMLQPRNVGYASAANSVGLVVGSLTSYTLLLHLTGDGALTVGQFVQICGVVFLVVTVAVAVFKTEAPEPQDPPALQAGPAEGAEEDSEAPATPSSAPGLRVRGSSSEEEREEEDAALLPPPTPRPSTSLCRPGVGAAIASTYADIWRVIQLPTVQGFALVLLTGKVAFSAFDSGMDLELLEKGFPRSTLVSVGVAMSVADVAFSAALSGLAAGPRPLDLWMGAYLPRVVTLGACLALLVGLPAGEGEGQAPAVSTAWIVAFLLCYGVYKACGTAQFVAQMAFHSRVADPAIGGTFMTLLNTIANLGHMWAAPTSLAAMRVVESHSCALPGQASQPCGEGQGLSAAQCVQAGGECKEERDGFSLVVGGLLLAAVVWFFLMRPRTAALTAAPISAWRAPK